MTMPSYRNTLLCRYRYDPLDRLVDCMPSAQSRAQRFYQKDRLATEIQDGVQRLIMQHDDRLLAQQQRQSGTVETRLLATDQQRSVLKVPGTTECDFFAYTAYGHRPAQSGLLSLLGFNGERPDPVTGHYLLGNGYRAFNPVLMRFNSPDSWSPFGKGGSNAYTYCGADPVNRTDTTGRSWLSRLFSNPAYLKSTILKNRVNIAADFETFEDYTRGLFFKKEKRLNVIIHGNGVRKNGTHLPVSLGEELLPDLFTKKLSNTSLNTNKHKSLRLIMCYGASGENPFAQQISNLTGLPTKSYDGPIYYRRGHEENWIHIHKIRPSNHPDDLEFTYHPANFKPARKKSEDIRYSP